MILPPPTTGFSRGRSWAELRMSRDPCLKLVPQMENKMSEASDLIERMERETGQRWGENGGDNFAMAGLIGAMSRIMGQSPSTYREQDDVAAGVLIRHQMSREYQSKREREKMMVALLMEGLSPDAIKDLMG